MTRPRLRLVLAFLFALAAFTRPSAAQAHEKCSQLSGDSSSSSPHACNGISVGAPKVFDNRSLTLKIEALSQTLGQQSFIDQKSVATALGNFQGFSQSDTSTAFSLTTTPTPATDVKTQLNTGLVDSSGHRLPNTFQRTTDVSRAAITPTAPTLDAAQTFSGFSPTYGPNASDLLQDQINLNYQIVNLRMIIERALSDRLLSDTPGGPDANKTRLQAVLGFNVTIDPPRTANDAVAVVEITLEPCKKDNEKETCATKSASAQGPLSLVALMPQEKTYNTATVSTKSNAFAGSAVVSNFQLGATVRKRGQTFYLYRDNDTISYERMTGDTGKLVFGWMFRPVLGRRSVSPGLRQLFAITALPNVDCVKPIVSDKDVLGNVCTGNLRASVRTYWKKYDRGTLTSYERHDTNRALDFWHTLTLGATTPQIFGDKGMRYLNDARYIVAVQSSSVYEDELRPIVSSVTWRPIGAKSIVVSAQGRNFFSNTQVALGDKIYTKPEDGLTLKSNQAFDLVTTLDALVNGPGTILGRYGNGVPLINTSTPQIPGFGPNGVEIVGTEIGPSLGGRRRLEVVLRGNASDEDLAQYRAARSRLAQSQSQLRQFEEQTRTIQEAAAAQHSAKSRAQAQLAQQHIAALTAQFGSLESLKVKTESAQSEISAADRDSAETQRRIRASYPLTGVTDLVNNSPVISINGKAVEFPYDLFPDPTLGGTRIRATITDDYLSGSSGVVKVSWPFLPSDKWTVTSPFFDPDKAFPITRVSSSKIIVKRIDGWSFKRGPEIDDKIPVCWTLHAAAAEFALTDGCVPKPISETCKKKVDPCDPPAVEIISDYAIAITAKDLPDQIVLVGPQVGPQKTIYNLTVPPIKAKDDKPTAIELKQYDALLLDIDAADLDNVKDGADFSGIDAAKANGASIHFLLPKPDPKNLDPKTNKPKPPSAIKIEITRELTSRPGSVDVAFYAGSDLIGTRQLHITRTDWTSKGDK